jgi:hypothetical protein
MRDPALHIRCSDFITIAQKYGLSVRDVNELMQEAFKYSIRTRVFVTTKAKGKKKSDRSIDSDSAVLDQFNRIYMGVMLSNNIKAIPITKTSPQYLTLKEVCWLALEFCKLFGLDQEEGIKLYIELGVKLLGKKFGIYRFKGYSPKIVDYYRDILIIKNDPNPNKTNLMITAWTAAVMAYYHTTISLDNDAQRVHFVHAKNEAEAAGADRCDWINAQFEKYLFLNSIPAFTQFYGDQAKLNYQLYMAKVKKEAPSKEEQAYFNNIDNEKKIQSKASIQEARIREERLHNLMQRAGSEDAG